MTLEQLYKQLPEKARKMELILSSDEEGNYFSKFTGGIEYAKWRNGEIVEEGEGGVDCLILYP